MLLVRLPSETPMCVHGETHTRLFSAALLVPERLQIPLSLHAQENGSLHFGSFIQWDFVCVVKMNE